MLFSKDKKIIFIAVPKTGTTSIEKAICKLDQGILRNKIILETGEIISVNKHIKISELEKLLGDSASDFKYFAFIRDPKEHVFSRYRFYKIGRAAERAASKKNHVPNLKLKTWLAQKLPFVLWLFIYPLRTQTRFIKKQNQSISLYIGRFENLNSDIKKMLDLMGYSFDDFKMPLINRSPTLNLSKKENFWLSIIVNIKLYRDIALHKKINNEKA